MRQDIQPLLPSLPGQSRAAPFYLLSFSYATLTWRLGKQKWGQVQAGLKGVPSPEGRGVIVGGLGLSGVPQGPLLPTNSGNGCK